MLLQKLQLLSFYKMTSIYTPQLDLMTMVQSVMASASQPSLTQDKTT